MAKKKPKKKKVVKKTKKKKKLRTIASSKDPNIVEVYEKKITFICPNRGKVTQIVKVKKLKSFEFEQKNIIKENDNDPISKIEQSESLEDLTQESGEEDVG